MTTIRLCLFSLPYSSSVRLRRVIAPSGASEDLHSNANSISLLVLVAGIQESDSLHSAESLTPVEIDLTFKSTLPLFLHITYLNMKVVDIISLLPPTAVLYARVSNLQSWQMVANFQQLTSGKCVNPLRKLIAVKMMNLFVVDLYNLKFNNITLHLRTLYGRPITNQNKNLRDETNKMT